MAGCQWRNGDFVLRSGRQMRYTLPMQDATRDHGLQPLDSVMSRWQLTNHQLVDESAEQLNHKQAQRARKGRQLTLHLRQKLARTLNAAILARLPKEQRVNFSPYSHKQLFNYAKDHLASWTDPNEPLMPK
jgi:hypothetical protein